jgi:hypothetical protein
LFIDRLYFYIRDELASLGRGANKGLIDFLSLQLWLLLFADDLVLLATSFSMLSTLFQYVCDFCDANSLSINASKTELLVCGPDASNYSRNVAVRLGDHSIKVTTSFKYLGLQFDQ